ncbi:MAG: hypothetical protein PHT07_15140 [Paludibacter sp.]|nr:hypothetical protein [Paludibacter sp.]
MTQKTSQPLESFDPAVALINESQLAGSYRVVTNKTARNAIPSAKRIIGAIVSWTDTGVIYRMAFIGPDVTDTEWQKDTNWINVAVYNEAETANRSIFIATTGNDTTGDGSVGNPYLTIAKALSTVKKIIISGVTITISIGVGTFAMSMADLSVLNSISGAGILTIQGTLTLVDSGFTMGSAEALDPLTYSVSGGNTATWTLNQWKFYFLKSGTSYYPITGNALTPTISISGAVTGTEIYQAQTIINFGNTSALTQIIQAHLIFSQLNLSFPAFDVTIYNNIIEFNNCYIQGNAANFLTLGKGSTVGLLQTCFNGFRIIYNCETFSFNNLYCFNNTNSDIIQFSNSKLANHRNLVLENPNTGTTASCIYLSNDGEFKIAGTSTANNAYLKFVNSNMAFASGNNFRCDIQLLPSKVILVNTNYLFKHKANISDFSIGTFKMTFSNIYGVPNTRWFFDAMSEFVNLVSGRNVQIIGLIYPEVEQNLSAALADNAATNVVVGNKLQNRSIIIDYTIIRGTDYEMGTLQIISDGTNLVLAESTPVGDDVGVTFAVAFATNVLNLQCTLSSTGTAATIKYNVNRVMITPLTI